MNEWLALLAGLALVAYILRSRRTVRGVRADLRAVIAAQPGYAVTDAGGAPVFAVARALELDESALLPASSDATPTRRSGQGVAWEARQMIRPLGLELVEVVRAEPRAFASAATSRGRTEMAGVRHGRRITVRLEEASSMVDVSGAFPTFSLHATSQRWDGLGEAPGVVASWIGGLQPSRRWDGVVVESGEDGLLLRRDHESSRSWMHDLWLAEQLADAAACSARTPA